MSKKLVCFLSFLVLFVAILIPSLHVPMQSDDYAYYQLGLSMGAQAEHYLGWSGRLVTNILSAYLLNLLPHFAYEIANSLVFSLLILFVFLIPKAFSVEKFKDSFISLFIIFSLYWIANPSLGETSFWIVGSTNYLWTSMFVAGYFVYLFYNSIRETGVKENSIGLLLGFLAGCSNENTSLIVILITILIIFVEKNKKASLYAILGSVIGAGVLILSPGNQVRANLFYDWKELSFSEKFTLHFFERFPVVMSGYWQVYLVLVISLFAVCLITKPNKKQLFYAFIFFAGAFLANAAFVASPFIPPRAGNGALVFLLISLSFIVNAILESESRRLKIAYSSVVFAFVAVYFVPSYYLFNKAVSEVWAQSKIRDSMILDAKAKGLNEAQVPSFYYTKLLKDSDKLSTFDHSTVASYYGLDKITYVPALFSYAGINELPKIDVNFLVKPGVAIKSIYIYDEGGGYKSKLLFKVEGDINEALKNSTFLYVHLFMKDGTYLNRDTSAAALNIKGLMYAHADFGVDYHNLDRIEIGMYNTKEMLSSFVIRAPQFVRKR